MDEVLERARARIQQAIQKAELEKRGAMALALAIENNEIKLLLFEEHIFITSKKSSIVH